MVTNIYLFCDASVEPLSKVGFGAFLILSREELRQADLSNLKNQVQIQKFSATSSTKLEIQVILHALQLLKKENFHLTIFTDSQNIENLLNRREKLEARNYLSKSKNAEIINADLYRQFFNLYDIFKFDVIKLHGHMRKTEKDHFHEIFTLVDRSSRKALRNYLK